MKAKKTARILCALSVAALCLSCVSATAFAAGPFNGGEHGTVWLNGKDYRFTTLVESDVSTGTYYSTCYTDAAVVRVHRNVYGKWLTKNYGYVTAFGGVYITPKPVYGITFSGRVACPKGVSQVVEYTRVDTSICMSGDVSVTSEIYRVPI